MLWLSLLNSPGQPAKNFLPPKLENTAQGSDFAAGAALHCGVVDAQVQGVTLGCVNGDPQIEIAHHIFVGSKATWEVLPHGVVTFEQGPEARPSDTQ